MTGALFRGPLAYYKIPVDSPIGEIRTSTSSIHRKVHTLYGIIINLKKSNVAERERATMRLLLWVSKHPQFKEYLRMRSV